MIKKIVACFVFVIAILSPGLFVSADEGMWTLNNLPLKQLKEKYNFEPTPEWISKVQLSSARLPNCSSSFVSENGLIFTNGHCAEESVQALSTPGNNLYEKGFYARTYSQELRTDRTLRVLIKSGDATDWINRQIAEDKSGNPAEARQRAIAATQKQSSGLNNLTCEIVVLYQGAQYYNYCYKVYDDIRLVFSSEKNIWFMGGDADNFEYPRYTMDVAFFRAYENGKPAKIPNHLNWSKSGAEPEELIFVSGHPGRTARLLTSKALATERDVRVPFLLDLFRRREMTLQQFMLRGKEQHRIAESDLFSWQNSRKLYAGKIRGLQDPKLMADKIESEKKFFKDAYGNASLAGKYANGLIMIGEAQNEIRKNYAKYLLLAAGLGFDSEFYDYAQRFLTGHRGSVEANLEYEEAKLRDSLTHLVEVFGPDDPMIIEMQKKYGSTSHMAHALLADDVMNSMTSLVEFIKPYSEKYVRAMSNALEQERRGYTLLSDASFQLYGTNRYPDATFTLRLSFGKMSGYETDGKEIASTTTIGGMYKHSAEFGNKGDYKLPARWLARKKYVNLKTPLNFVSNLDITGGNSGSPVFNKNLEIVGIVFDSNIEGLVSDYDFNYAPNARSIAVDSRGIIEILSKIYRANRLVRELQK